MKKSIFYLSIQSSQGTAKKHSSIEASVRMGKLGAHFFRFNHRLIELGLVSDVGNERIPPAERNKFICAANPLRILRNLFVRVKPLAHLAEIFPFRIACRTDDCGGGGFELYGYDLFGLRFGNRLGYGALCGGSIRRRLRGYFLARGLSL